MQFGEGVPEGGSSCQSQHQPNYAKKVRVIVWKIRSFHSSSCSLSRPPLSVSVFLYLSPLPTVRLCCRPPGAQQSGSDDVCSLGPSPPPALRPDLLSSAVEYFLSSARASPRFIFHFLFLSPHLSDLRLCPFSSPIVPCHPVCGILHGVMMSILALQIN